MDALGARAYTNEEMQNRMKKLYRKFVTRVLLCVSMYMRCSSKFIVVIKSVIILEYIYIYVYMRECALRKIFTSHTHTHMHPRLAPSLHFQVVYGPTSGTVAPPCTMTR